jgi:hypothetical protein
LKGQTEAEKKVKNNNEAKKRMNINKLSFLPGKPIMTEIGKRTEEIKACIC